MSMEEKFKKAEQALAIIACTKQASAPQVAYGGVIFPSGYSELGHKDCVELAQKTLKELRPEFD